MFENLSDRLSRTLRNISGKGRLTEDNIKETLREVRMALLEADVALPVVREFINQVKERALGVEVNKSLTPGQEFIKIVQAELEKAMGEANETLNLGNTTAGSDFNGWFARGWVKQPVSLNWLNFCNSVIKRK